MAGAHAVIAARLEGHGPHMLSPHEHRARERTLTNAHSSDVRDTTTAVVLKNDDLVFLTSRSGDVPWRLPHAMGLFFNDCRFLDGYELRINGQQPIALSSDDADGTRTVHYVANPTLRRGRGKADIAKQTIVVQRERVIQDGVRELLHVTNYGAVSVRLTIEFRFRSHFEDIFVLRGLIPRSHGTHRPPRIAGSASVKLSYAGRDGVVRVTEISFSPTPDKLEPHRAAFAVALEPGAGQTISIAIRPHEALEQPADGAGSDRPRLVKVESRQNLGSKADSTDREARIAASGALFEQIYSRALRDLDLLRSELAGMHFFAAGVPWYVTLFGRDSLISAMQMLPYESTTARETLQLLAQYQATKPDQYRDAEPGKILHEYRTGELARLDAIPQSPAYYGSIDATLLFLIALAEYVNWTGDVALVRELRPHVDAALTWSREYADHDGDGYLDYAGSYANGLVNQGWKDSGNAIVNADGSLATPPIAPCEVQAYAYRAWRDGAQLFRVLGEDARAAALDADADALQGRFERDYWSNRLGCYVLARQQGGRPAEVVSSNAGQVLWGGIAGGEHAARVCERLLQPDMFSGWGIRTLSATATAFNPASYHNGSVWPHDNALILRGLRRYGHDAAALRVFVALLDAVGRMPNYRMPELYCGFPRQPNEERPVRYPVACSPQAWAAGALLDALSATLGLQPCAPRGELTITRPLLPQRLDWLELRGVTVGSACLDLRFRRVDEYGNADAECTIRHGQLDVRVSNGSRPNIAP